MDIANSSWVNSCHPKGTTNVGISFALHLFVTNPFHPTSIQVETSVDAMLTNGESPMPVIEAEKVKTKKTYTNSGHVIASLAHIEYRPTFTDVRKLLFCFL